MSEKLYAGHGKAIETKYGRALKLGFSEAELTLMQENLNERGYVNILVSATKGNAEAFYGVIDTWKPEPKKEPEGDMPF